MDGVNVLIMTTVTTEASIALIKAVDARADVAILPYNEPSSHRLLRRQGRAAELEAIALSPEMLRQLKETEVIFTLDCPSNLPTLAPRLQWVHRAGAGVDHFGPGGGTGLWESAVHITTLGGFNSRAIAEFTLGLMLNQVKRFPQFTRAQDKKLYERAQGSSLAGKKVGIVGLGRIGAETARLCKAFGMTVVASRRSPTPEPPPNVDRLLGPDGLDELLAGADFVVLALPLLPEYDGFFGEHAFKQMKKTGVLVNIARGALVDDGALIKAIQTGEIAGAALDTFREEPLPSSSPLWDLPNVTITPHAAASVTDYALEAAKEFAENLRRYIAGEPLLNLVDRQKGY